MVTVIMHQLMMNHMAMIFQVDANVSNLILIRPSGELGKMTWKNIGFGKKIRKLFFINIKFIN